MSMDLLDTPVRLTWDISTDTSALEGARLVEVAEAIVEGGAFFVTLQGQPLRHPALGDILGVLEGACQLMISCSGYNDELEHLNLLTPSGCQLLLDVSRFINTDHGLNEPSLQEALQALRDAGHEPLLCLTPLRNNLSNIPDLLRFCASRKVAKFKLPNAHIGDSFDQYSPDDLPRWQDLERFRRMWTEFTAESVSMPALEIHDLFLWEIMTPGQEQVRSEYGGCQAGNSLAHIDCAGIVHPCAAWPQPLGQLPAETLLEIWAGKERTTVREQVGNTPSGCHNCNDVDICFGGCRGLSLHLNKDEGGRDLMCSGPR